MATKSKLANPATLAPNGDNPIKPPMTQAEKKQAAQERAARGPSAKAKGQGHKPVKAPTRDTAAEAKAKATAAAHYAKEKERAAAEKAEKKLHEKVRKLGLVDEAKVLTQEYLGIVAQTDSLSNKIVLFAIRCKTVENYQTAWDDAYEDLRNAKGSDVPEVIPTTWRNYRAVMKWALETGNLTDSKGSPRSYNSLMQGKAAINWAKSEGHGDLSLDKAIAKRKDAAKGEATLTGVQGGKAQQAPARSNPEGTSNEDLIGAMQGIALLDQIATRLLEDEKQGDALLPTKARWLEKAVTAALVRYNEHLEELVTPPAADTEIAQAAAQGPELAVVGGKRKGRK